MKVVVAINRTTPLESLPQFLSVPEVCAYIGVSRNTGYGLVASGEIPSVKFGRLVRVPRAALAALLEPRK